MRAGLLKHWVTVERITPTRNDAGEIMRAWATAEERWGAIDPLSGNERYAAQQVSPNVSHRIRLRFGSTVTAKDRITHAGRTFDINAVLNSGERNRQLELLCVEQV